MNDFDYLTVAETTLDHLFDFFTESESLEDCDIDLIDGVLTVIFEDDTRLIINKQEPVQQLWLAVPEGPAHYKYDRDKCVWVDEKTSEELLIALQRVLSAKLGQEIEITNQ